MDSDRTCKIYRSVTKDFITHSAAGFLSFRFLLVPFVIKSYRAVVPNLFVTRDQFAFTNGVGETGEGAQASFTCGLGVGAPATGSDAEQPG